MKTIRVVIPNKRLLIRFIFSGMFYFMNGILTSMYFDIFYVWVTITHFRLITNGSMDSHPFYPFSPMFVFTPLKHLLLLQVIELTPLPKYLYAYTVV